MPHKFPPHLKEWLDRNMPLTHKMWWMRAQTMDVRPMKVNDDGLVSHYMRFALYDIDALPGSKAGYNVDIQIDPNLSDFRIKDRVSLFGHEPVDATHLSFPRYLYHHEMRVFGPCFQPQFVDMNRPPSAQLRAIVEGSGGERKMKFWGVLFEMSGAAKEEAHAYVKAGTNLEKHYDILSKAIDCHVRKEPPLDFICLNPRPENTQGGALVE